jgi:hypothetical protein
VLEIDQAQALAFRVAGNNLHRRTDPLTAIAACGLQEYPPGWASVALHARTRGEPDQGSVVTVNAMRGSPYLVPRSDVAIFTTALVPADERGLRALVGHLAAKELEAEGATVGDSLQLVAAAAREGLAAGPLERDEFHQALRERLPVWVLPWCRGCQSHHVRPGLWRALGALGVTSMPGRATFELAAQPPASPSPGEARAELVRRFLRCFGPATHSQLASWAQTSPAHAKAAVASVEGELEVVRLERQQRLILAEEIERLENPPAAQGVRLLGGHDPYVAQPDRTTVAPDPALRKRMFPAVGRPGVILDRGQLAGLWRGRKRGALLDIEVEWLAQPADVAAEANAIAILRGCERARIAA